MKHSTQSTKYQGSGPTSPKHYEQGERYDP